VSHDPKAAAGDFTVNVENDCDSNDFYCVQLLNSNFSDIKLHNSFSVLSDFSQVDDDSVNEAGDLFNDNSITTEVDVDTHCYDGATFTDCSIDEISCSSIDCDDFVNTPGMYNNGAILHGLKDITKNVNGLSIGHLNVRSVLPKVDQIRYILCKAQFDIFCLNETWLDSTVGQHEYDVDGYITVNKPRNRRGGGVLIYVKKGIEFKRRLDIESKDLECIWLQLRIHKKELLLCSMYRPPSMGSDYFEKMLDTIEVACLEEKMVVIAGDLNIHY
jgi:hypothetical protein